jgi:hypothetical protein
MRCQIKIDIVSERPGFRLPIYAFRSVSIFLTKINFFEGTLKQSIFAFQLKSTGQKIQQKQSCSIRRIYDDEQILIEIFH